MATAANPETQTVRCVKITRPDTHGDLWVMQEVASFSAAAEFDGAEPGERVTLELVEMTRKELDELPDFDGW